MSSFQEAISAQREQLVTQMKSFPIVAAVLGPGEKDVTYLKRCQIRDTLVAQAVDAFFPEDLVDPHSELPLLDQEELILADRRVNLIFVLNTSEGPLAQLSAFARNLDITSKTTVLVPEEYYIPGETFPTDIMERYSNRWRFSPAELKRCDLVRECTSRARLERLSNSPLLRSFS